MTTIDDLLPPIDPTPSPEGALDVWVRCGRTPHYVQQKAHLATIRADWTFDSGHDLAAESVAAALGSHCTCVTTEDVVIPVVRDWLRYQLRLAIPPICRSGNRWSAGPIITLECSCHLFDDAAAAANHARLPAHLSSRGQATFLYVDDLVRQVRDAYGPALTSPTDELELQASASRCVTGGAAELKRLWEFGLSARTIRDLHLVVAPPGRDPLPAEFYRIAATTAVDLEWVGRTLRGNYCYSRSVQRLAPQLAGSMTDVDMVHPCARVHWLHLGVDPDIAVALSRAGYKPLDAALLAEAAGTSCREAAAALHAWVRLGYCPEPAFLAGYAAATGTGRIRATTHLFAYVSELPRDNDMLEFLHPTHAPPCL